MRLRTINRRKRSREDYNHTVAFDLTLWRGFGLKRKRSGPMRVLMSHTADGDWRCTYRGNRKNTFRRFMPRMGLEAFREAGDDRTVVRK